MASLPSRADNSFHVVVIEQVDSCLLDGLVIRGGHASDGGGGLQIRDSNPTLWNCTFTQNWGPKGGAIFIPRGGRLFLRGPEIHHCKFMVNSSTYYGGGLHTEDDNLLLTDCEFFANTSSYYGGAVASGPADVSLSGCVFAQPCRQWRRSLSYGRQSSPDQLHLRGERGRVVQVYTLWGSRVRQGLVHQPSHCDRLPVQEQQGRVWGGDPGESDRAAGLSLHGQRRFVACRCPWLLRGADGRELPLRRESNIGHHWRGGEPWLAAVHELHFRRQSVARRQCVLRVRRSRFGRGQHLHQLHHLGDRPWPRSQEGLAGQDGGDLLRRPGRLPRRRQS